MNHTISCLSRIFGIIAMSYCGIVADVYGEGSAQATLIGKYVSSPAGGVILASTDQDETAALNSVKVLCPAGQYVYKCGNYRVGFSWLRGISVDNDTNASSSHNYYISNNQSELLEQMRAFFTPESTAIEYCQTEDSNGNCITKELTDNDVRVADRDKILNSVCNPFDANTAVTCAYCPDSANVPVSSVKIAMGQDAITTTDWRFHTVADCYMDEFTDSTGTYQYFKDDQTSTPETCYYTNTSPGALIALNGDSIIGFTSGTNTSNTANTVNITPRKTGRLQTQNP